MTVSPEPRLGRTERQLLAMSAQILEKRAELGDRVTISDKLARAIAGYLRRQLQRGG